MAGPTNERIFRSFSVAQRLESVKREGEYLGSRMHAGHQVHLYRMEGFFCEVWMRFGLQAVEWVEVATNLEILSEYVKDIPLSALLSTGDRS